VRKLAKASNPNVNLDNITQGSKFTICNAKDSKAYNIINRLKEIEQN
jgi:hypothetical protein